MKYKQIFQNYRYFSICLSGFILMISPVVIVLNLFALSVLVANYRLTSVKLVLQWLEVPLCVLMGLLFICGFAIMLVGYGTWRATVEESKRPAGND